MTDQRTDRYADAIYDVVVDHPMWIGDDGKPLDYLPERATRLLECVYQAAAAVIALADAEVDDPTEGYTLCGLSACHMIGTCQARSGCEYATAAEDGAR